jgi:hypothetical protein
MTPAMLLSRIQTGFFQAESVGTANMESLVFILSIPRKPEYADWRGTRAESLALLFIKKRRIREYEKENIKHSADDMHGAVTAAKLYTACYGGG